MKTKVFCALIIATILISSVTSLAEDITTNIQVAFNTINLKVNGKNVSSANILYNGRTYVQIRDVSNMFNKTVEWDDKTKTANITDEEIIPSFNGNNELEQAFIKAHEYKGLYDLARDIKEIKSTLYYDQVQINALNINSQLSSNHIKECTTSLSNKTDYMNKTHINDSEYSIYADILILISKSLISYSKASNNLKDFYYSKSVNEEDFNLYTKNLEEGNKLIEQAISKANDKYLDYALEIVK